MLKNLQFHSLPGSAISVKDVYKRQHIFFSARMRRSKYSAVPMHQINQKRQWHPPHLQQLHLNTLGHNHKDMSRISRIIFYSFKNYKVCMFFSFDIILPVAVDVYKRQEYT